MYVDTGHLGELSHQAARIDALYDARVYAVDKLRYEYVKRLIDNLIERYTRYATRRINPVTESIDLWLNLKKFFQTYYFQRHGKFLTTRACLTIRLKQFSYDNDEHLYVEWFQPLFERIINERVRGNTQNAITVSLVDFASDEPTIQFGVIPWGIYHKQRRT